MEFPKIRPTIIIAIIHKPKIPNITVWGRGRVGEVSTVLANIIIKQTISQTLVILCY